jgi:hypothetical protein
MDLASGGSDREPVPIIQKISADVTNLPLLQVFGNPRRATNSRLVHRMILE